MVLQLQSDHGKGRSLHRKSGLWWTFSRLMTDLRSLIAIFTFLFLLVMPIAMLIIGREVFTAMTTGQDLSHRAVDGSISFHLFDNPLLLNDALIVFLLFVVTLSSVAVITLGGSLFRPLYRRDTVDFEWSLPLTKNEWFLGRALALIAGLSIIYIVNSFATSAILYAWGLKDILPTFLLIYLKTYLAAIVFTGFSLVIFSLSGRLFDAIVINVALHITCPFLLLISGSMPENTLLRGIMWFFAPAIDSYRAVVAAKSFFYYAVLIVFWFVLSWFCATKRPAEWGGRKTGTLRWFHGAQPIFSFIGSVIVSNLFAVLDPSPMRTTLLKPLFIIGALLGAFLGQLVSSAVTGKTLQRVTGEDSENTKLHPILQEWLWSLGGVALLYAFTLIG
ncbi:MAG TPA: hypothetical protein GX734_06845 [Clostridiaceae bacterium]|nr:hypothetical protein [Clostridiaceae bacterium]